jgi:hypothetical protein
MVVGGVVAICILIILFILFRPKSSRYIRSVTSTRNSHERGFGDY